MLTRRDFAVLLLGAAAAGTAAAAGFGYLWWLGPTAFEVLGPSATAFSATLFTKHAALMIATALLLTLALLLAKWRIAAEPSRHSRTVLAVLAVAAGMGGLAATARWWFAWALTALGF